jgi:uncharacterized phage protein (TIGR02220 family)
MDFKKLKESNLLVEEYVFLLMLYEKVEWNKFTFWMRSDDLQQMIENLEKNMYITNSEEGYVLRGKGRELFEAPKDNVVEIIAYLNQKTGKSFRANVASNRAIVSARLNEGYSVDEIKRMIDVMTSKWQNTKMEIYLRPETLFGATKFQTYINERSNDTSWANERV